MQAVLLNFIDLFVFVSNGLIVVWVIASWVPSMRHWGWVQQCGELAEVVLSPARRVIPSAGGLDLSPIVTIVVLQLIQTLAHQYL